MRASRVCTIRASRFRLTVCIKFHRAFLSALYLYCVTCSFPSASERVCRARRDRRWWIFICRGWRGKKKEDTRQRGNMKLILMAVSLSTGGTARALHRNINGAIRHPTIITLEINNPLCPGARVNTARFLQQREEIRLRKKDLFKK